MSARDNANTASRMGSIDGGDDQIGCFHLEFIGGPYDGYEERCRTRPEFLATDVVWFVGQHALLRPDGQAPKAMPWPSRGSLTSAALYELDVGNGRHRYRFVGAISVKDLSDCMRESPR